MELPDYWLPRPKTVFTRRQRTEFDRLLARAKSAGAKTPIQYTLSYPKWQFLCYAADQHRIAMHGTSDPNIQVFEPRQSNDLNPFGNQKAIYAAGDGLWAMFFAIVDRSRFPMSLNNACIRLVDAAGLVSEPRYVFSISQEVLPRRPWRAGYVYLLPAETFVAMPSLNFGPYEVRIPQLASMQAVMPLAKLEVTPEDFPFLSQIRGHNDARLAEYGRAMQTGAPWPE